MFYVHILCSNLRQTTKFHSIIPNFSKVMPYFARSTRECLHFSKHLPQCTNVYYLTINRRLKHTNYRGTTLSETANRTQWKYFFQRFIGYVMFKMSTGRNAYIHTVGLQVKCKNSRSDWSRLIRHNVVRVRDNWMKLRLTKLFLILVMFCTPLCRHHPQRRSTTISGVIHTRVHCPNTSLTCLTAILSHRCYINRVTKF